MNSLQPFPEEFQRNLSKVAVMVYDSKVKKYPLLDAENNEIPGGGDFNRANAYKESTVLPSFEVLASELISKKAKMMPETLTEPLTDPFIALPKKTTAHNENIEMLHGDHRIETPKIIQPITSTNKGISDREQISNINLNKYHISEYLSETLPDDIFGPEKETWESNTSYLQTNDCDDLILWHDCNDEIEEIEESNLAPFFQVAEIYPMLRKNKKLPKIFPEPMDGTPIPLTDPVVKTKPSKPSKKTPVQESAAESMIPGVVRSLMDRIFGATGPPPSEEGEDEQDRLHSERPKWDNNMEFLMSCIATSVGLGNVWRFPFVAYENGGGAFLVPYCIVLVLIGNSMYYLETSLGQFSSSNNVRLWALCPAMKGTGYAQALGASYVLSYYVSIIALCVYYLFASFAAHLPWGVCLDEWPNCVPSVLPPNFVLGSIGENATGSAEYYFKRSVLRQSNGIDNGIGLPLWDLTLCLFASWLTIFLVVVRGVKSSGKAAWFLALFPYVIMFILLIRAVTLPGAGKGIIFFVRPVWQKLAEIKVWYAAVTQVFFSLSVCSGALIMYASYNGFRTNVFKFSMIVSILDTCTSMLSGITIFGVLGNLAFQMGYEDVQRVIGAGGTSLAFISYPDAIAKTPLAPQVFAVLFFLMMVVLGVGSGVALLSTINTVMLDSFPKVPVFYLSFVNCTAFFLFGLVYVTPGGQYILELVDYFGGTFMRLFAAISESIGVFWIYGLENICLDIEFMLRRRPTAYWRICWAVVTPLLMTTVFTYAVITRKALRFGKTYIYPNAAYFCGNFMQWSGMAMIPIFICITIYKYRGKTCKESVKTAFTKRPTYGPGFRELRHEWRAYVTEAKKDRMLKRKNWLNHIYLSLIGGYRTGPK